MSSSGGVPRVRRLADALIDQIAAGRGGRAAGLGGQGAGRERARRRRRRGSASRCATAARDWIAVTRRRLRHDARRTRASRSSATPPASSREPRTSRASRPTAFAARRCPRSRRSRSCACARGRAARRRASSSGSRRAVQHASARSGAPRGTRVEVARPVRQRAGAAQVPEVRDHRVGPRRRLAGARRAGAARGPLRRAARRPPGAGAGRRSRIRSIASPRCSARRRRRPASGVEHREGPARGHGFVSRPDHHRADPGRDPPVREPAAGARPPAPARAPRGLPRRAAARPLPGGGALPRAAARGRRRERAPGEVGGALRGSAGDPPAGAPRRARAVARRALARAGGRRHRQRAASRRSARPRRATEPAGDWLFADPRGRRSPCPAGDGARSPSRRPARRCASASCGCSGSCSPPTWCSRASRTCCWSISTPRTSACSTSGCARAGSRAASSARACSSRSRSRWPPGGRRAGEQADGAARLRLRDRAVRREHRRAARACRRCSRAAIRRRCCAGLPDELAEGEAARAGRARARAADRVFATLACHAARRKGDVLDPREQRALLDALDAIPWAPTCPHGRPVVVPFELVRDRAPLRRR